MPEDKEVVDARVAAEVAFVTSACQEAQAEVLAPGDSIVVTAQSASLAQVAGRYFPARGQVRVDPRLESPAKWQVKRGD